MIESITNTINQLNSLAGSLTLFIPTLIGLCSVISASLPKPINDGILATVHKWVNRLAFNFGNAANKQ